MALFPYAAIIILINFPSHKRKEMSWTDFLLLFTVRQILLFQRKIPFKTFALPFSLNDFIHTLIFMNKGSQQDDFQPSQLLIYPSLYSWEQKHGKILCYTIFNIHFQSFIPQDVVGCFFSQWCFNIWIWYNLLLLKHLVTFALCLIQFWCELSQLLFRGRSKVIFFLTSLHGI